MNDAAEDALADLFFHGSVTDALKQLQLLDVCLKGYLEDVYWVANKVRPAAVSFRLTAKDLDAKPLGHLLIMFRRHCDNEPLIKDLRQVERDRKHIAHRALLLSIEIPAKADLMKAKKEATIRAKKIQLLARSCTMTILAELRRVREWLPKDQRNPEWR